MESSCWIDLVKKKLVMAVKVVRVETLWDGFCFLLHQIHDSLRDAYHQCHFHDKLYQASVPQVQVVLVAGFFLELRSNTEIR